MGTTIVEIDIEIKNKISRKKHWESKNSYNCK